MGAAPLYHGDRLTRDEFERRYQAMPPGQKLELIEGVVHSREPVRFPGASSPVVSLITWIGTYRTATPGTDAGLHGTIRLDSRNEPQPDVALLLSPAHGGRARVSAEDYLEGA